MTPGGWLTPRGAAAAVTLGALVALGAGALGVGMLAVFFVSGSLLSERNAGPPARTAAQVLANGWTAGAGSLLLMVRPELGWPVLAGGLAAAQADTWATEIGARSPHLPVLLTTRHSVPHGTSGGVTGLGSLGAAAGAVLMSALAALGTHPGLAAAAAVGGITGAFADSLAGATLQATWRCETCGNPVDAPRHCDGPARRLRGVSWVSNHVVNALGTGVGSAAALGAYALLS